MGVGLNVKVEMLDGKIILHLDGRLDSSSAPILEKQLNNLIGEGHHLLFLDFVRIHYLSSAGMRVLLSAAKQLKAKKGNLFLFSLGEEVLEVVKMAGFDKILTIFSSEKEAFQFYQK